MSHRKTHSHIYQSRLHILTTLFVVVLPFLFLFFFSHVAHLESAHLLNDIRTSLVRLVIAYIIAVVFAWVSAVLFYKGKSALIALPIFDVLQSFPTFGLLPLATYAWGATDSTIIFFLVITIIWPLFFSIISSLKLVRRDWNEAVEIAGLKGFAYVRHFLFPVSLTGLITGSIIGLGEGWEALVGTEIIVGMHDGLGSFFITFSQNTSVTMFGIFGFLLLIFSINKLLWLPLLEWSHLKMEE